MNERIKEIRKSLGMTQSTFASKIGLSRNYIAQLEIGTRIPPDRTISDICREFSINEDWLRTGEGDMYVPVEDETAAVVASLLDENNPLFDMIVKVVREYNKLDDKSKRVIDRFIDDTLAEQDHRHDEQHIYAAYHASHNAGIGTMGSNYNDSNEEHKRTFDY